MANVDQAQNAGNPPKEAKEAGWSPYLVAGLIAVALIAALIVLLGKDSTSKLNTVATTVLVMALIAAFALQFLPSKGSSVAALCGNYRACVAWLLALGGGALVVFVLVKVLLQLSSGGVGAVASLPLMVLVGVIVLLIVISLVTLTFSVLGLASPTEALGLPDGSVRSIIALMLLVLFSIMGFFLYDTIAHGIQDPTTHAFREVPEKAVDIAKQLITLLGTLVTAVAAFYFGTNAVQTAQAATLKGMSSASGPTLASIHPNPLAPGGQAQVLTIAGSKFGKFAKLHLEQKGQADIDGQDVKSTDGTVTAKITVPAGASGKWDVVLSDGTHAVTISEIEIKSP